MISDEGYILRLIKYNGGHIGESQYQAPISIILKAMLKNIKKNSDEQSQIGNSFRVLIALDL